MFRVGLGQDSHRLKTKNEKRKTKNLILGGVEISEKYCLEADSDGDVIIHSLCNALSTA
ncbi:2-C-methyl-D-erythritol 2,4-cyclodiphosphate synthase, partial [Patescibacteria group bacterium]|nr:2-C-methyl-D-erythritol 2,4-cyclodiphosphate synthase [Patescibacteria group bacterium]